MEKKKDEWKPDENKMRTRPAGRLLFTMALPLILSMLVQAVYNVVDSVYVSQISESAVTALSLAFPVQNLLIAVSVGTAVGVNALLSRSLGEKNFAEANRAAQNGLFLSLVSALVFLVLGLCFSRLYFQAQISDPEIVEGGTQYVLICTVFSFGLFGQVMMERLLQSTGKSFYAMLSQLVGAVANIVLDPIFIFGWLGMPAMGVAGAALATVLGQIMGFCVGVYCNARFNREISISPRRFRPSWPTIRRIYGVGLPSMVMQSIGSVMTFGMNQILLVFSTTATAVFGVYFKLQSFVFMPVFGLNNGMVPIVAYNYGAHHKDRISHTIRLSVLTATCIMLVGTLIFELMPDVLMGFFDASEEMTRMGVRALRIIAVHFVLAGFCIVAGSVFQAMGRGLFSLINSLIRQLVVLLPVAFLFSRIGGLDAVWWAFPVAETASLLISAFFLRRIYREQIATL